MVELSDSRWRSIDDLLLTFYEATDLADLRRRVMTGFKELVAYDKGFFDLCDADQSERFVFYDPVSVDMTDEELLSYYQSYQAADFVAWLFSVNNPVVYRDSTIVSDEAREQSEIYREWMVPMNIHFSMGSTQVARGRIYGSITLFRHRGAPDFTVEEEECLTVLNRHLSAQLAAAYPDGLHRDEGGALVERSTLTEREQEIAGLIAEGLSNQQIGLRLYISENTVKKHVKGIYHKMNVSNRHQLMAELYRNAEIVVDAKERP
ncbi:helix-turn-helix transcriptional regulator [Eggerthella sinensis]|uniref:Helix-turn-helix transcriptional regulator n=1 Tax=Eggerthella sinensis TaxID=242230 RepID=A0A3N0IUN7_9ACTN|nr:response regulator transcription factor [Eggerthella sinensis]RDB69934.1 helix-turn-helix transcriptional regulator [Eggerthella sinensis]RNM40675.1 helix-turn-helix transcriptional regulator [Eggerthella sinensis]